MMMMKMLACTPKEERSRYEKYGTLRQERIAG